jgi:cell division protein FtsZ
MVLKKTKKIKVAKNKVATKRRKKVLVSKKFTRPNFGTKFGRVRKPKVKIKKELKKLKMKVKRGLKIQKIKRAGKTKKALKIKKKSVIKKIQKLSYKINKIPKKVSPKRTPTDFPAKEIFRTRIKVIGIGGGGGSIVSEIGRSLEKATFVIADTDIRALKKRQGIKYFWFGENFTHGLGTGVNPELAKEAAESEKEKITKLFKDQDIVILIASLGGGLGSGATPVFAEAAKSFGAITFGIFTLPFRFEGENKSKIAKKALSSLRNSLNVSITIPNERIFKIIDDNTAITKAFSIVNKNLIESLESLIDLIYNPGVINIDFADLRTILKGRGNLAFLNTIEERGKNRADKIAEKLLYNPLYQSNNFIPEKILFNISGGSNLSMFEVEKISKSIADFYPKAKIIFGISKDSKAKNKIKTTLLMAGPSRSVEITKVKEQEKPEVVSREKTAKKEKPLAGRKKAKKSIPKKAPEHKKTEVQIGSLIPIFEKRVATAREGLSQSESPRPRASREAGAPDLASARDAVAAGERKFNIVEITSSPAKKAIRRNALEIKKAQEMEESKRLAQEKEWEIPAFLRRVKFKS